jgi:methyltransferase
MPVLIAGALIFLPMIAEAILSARHDCELRALGAIEPPGDVYKAMQLAYPGGFLLMLAEGWFRHIEWNALTAAGCGLFIVAKALKYWAIASLGERWTFRVLVPPGSARTLTGPYRWLRHPNYIAVAGELIAVALTMRAVFTGLPVVVAFTLLMRRRVGIEENALAAGRIRP